MSSVIEEALQKTTKVETLDRKEIGKDLDKTRALRQNTFLAEKTLRGTLDKEIARLESLYASSSVAGVDAKILSPEVLGWRHERTGTSRAGIPKYVQIPKLALLDLSCDELRFHSSNATNQWVIGIPSVLGPHYRDVASSLRVSEQIAYTFKGVIPSKTRDLIRDNQKKFDKMLILADAPIEAWDYRKVPAPISLGDPLLLGLKGDQLWVLDVFDPTPVEEYIASEFSN